MRTPKIRLLVVGLTLSVTACTNTFTGGDCAGNPCQNGGSCIDGVASHTCDCAPGYTGPDCAVDVDECLGSPCDANATCTNTPGSFTCACNPGYTGTGFSCHSASAISVSPTSLDFGKVAVWGNSSRQLTIANSSDVTLQVTIQSDSPHYQLSDGGSVDTAWVPAGGSTMVWVTFHPTVPGQVSGTLHLTSTGGSTSVSLTGLAVQPPTAPTAPDLDAASDTGLSQTDDDTADTTPTFSGSGVAANAGVTLYAGGTLVGSTLADASGTYSVTASARSDGLWLFTVRQVDAAGNESGDSPALAVVIDATAPNAPAAAPDLEAASDTGFSQTDNVTADATPTFTGSGAAADAVVRLYADWILVGTANADASGSYRVTAAPLPEGLMNLTVREVDAAGNESADSPALSVTIVAAPSAPATAPDLEAASDTGVSQTDGVTADATPTFTGKGVTANATVRLYADRILVGSTTADGLGSYRVTASPLPDGPASVIVRQVDAWGNASGDSPALAVIIDTTAPNAPASAPDLEAASDRGVSQTDNITSDNTPTFSGTVGASAVVALYADGILVGAATASGSGGYRVTASPLSDGVRRIRVRQVDAAGNESGDSPTLLVTIDTTAPDPPATAPDLRNTSDTGVSQTDDITADTTPTFTGVVAANAVVSLYAGGLLAGTATADGSGSYMVTVTATPLAEGARSMTVRQIDAAGNPSSDSPALAVTIDTTAPGALAATDLEAASDTGVSQTDDVTSDTTPTFAGSGVEAGALVRLYVDGALAGTTTAAGSYRVTSAALSYGLKSVTVRQLDAAGNEGPHSPALAVTINATGSCPPASASSRLMPNNAVRAIARIGCTVYLGGDFTTVGPVTGGGAPISTATGLAPANPPAIDGVVYAAQPDGAGGWYIGGAFTKVGGAARNNLARIGSDGGLYGWNPNVEAGPVYALAVDGSTVYAGGDFGLVGGAGRSRLAAIGTDGTLGSWNPGADGTVRALAVSGSAVYVGGDFTRILHDSPAWPFEVARNRLAAIGSDGALAGWNPGADGTVRALAVSGSAVYVGGDFIVVGGKARHSLAAVGTDGTVSDSFVFEFTDGAWHYRSVYALAMSGTTLYVGGDFNQITWPISAPRNRLAAIETSQAPATVTAWNPDADSLIPGIAVRTITVSGSTVYVGGDFSSINGVERNYVAAIGTDGALAAWDPNADLRVHALAVSGSAVYVGGELLTVGGLRRNHVAALGTDGALTAWDPNANGIVYALATLGSTIYLGGQFQSVGGAARNRLAAIETDGTLAAWSPDANNVVYALAASGSTVYAGGWFTTIGGVARKGLAAIGTAGNLSAWRADADLPVWALAVSGPTVYAGGDFTTVSGAARAGLAAIATDGTLSAWDPSANDLVQALLVSGSTVYVGGRFTTIGGAARMGLAAVGTDGTLSAWDPHPDFWVYALAASDSTVYAGGYFAHVGGVARNNLAAIATGGTLQTWNPNPDRSVYALAVNGSTVYAGGAFTRIGGQLRPYFAPISMVTGLVE